MSFRSNRRHRVPLRGRCWPALVLAGPLFFGVTAVAAGTADQPVTHWEIAGDLTEACSCAVPCTCNFREAPSPHHYCWTVFGLNIERGYYGEGKLDGLHLAAAHGRKSAVWYFDDQATPAQADALKAVAEALHWHTGSPIHFETVRITQVVGEKGNSLEVSGHGGFDADYIIGLDGKTPVVVENNSTWNIGRSIKGKVKKLKYRDHYGNKFEFEGVNSNQGKFDWTDQTPAYF